MALNTARLDEVASTQGLGKSAFRYLPDTGENDVARQALERLGAPQRPQPLYLSRSGPDPDPFVTLLPGLVRSFDWVGDSLLFTHLEALTGSAVFELVAILAADQESTLVLVDQPSMIFADDPTPPLSAVALRLGSTGGTAVVAWGEGAPPSSSQSRTLHGTRACDAWLAFAAVIAAGEVAAGEVVILHTRGEAQEGWVVLEVEEPPLWLP